MGISLSDLSPQAQQQALAKLLEQNRQVELNQHKQSKYHNQPTESRGHHFDSKKEARRFDELLVMERAGEITDLRLQHDFTLQEAYTLPTGERVRAIRYRADFTYKVTATGEFVAEDVKSRPTRTKEYLLKRKLMQERRGITVKEI